MRTLPEAPEPIESRQILRLVDEPRVEEPARPFMHDYELQMAEEGLAKHGSIWIPAVVGRSISNQTALHRPSDYDIETGELDETERVCVYIRNSLTRTINRYLNLEERPSLPQGTLVEYREPVRIARGHTFVLRKVGR